MSSNVLIDMLLAFKVKIADVPERQPDLLYGGVGRLWRKGGYLFATGYNDKILGAVTYVEASLGSAYIYVISEKVTQKRLCLFLKLARISIRVPEINVVNRVKDPVNHITRIANGATSFLVQKVNSFKRRA